MRLWVPREERLACYGQESANEILDSNDIDQDDPLRAALLDWIRLAGTFPGEPTSSRFRTASAAGLCQAVLYVSWTQ